MSVLAALTSRMSVLAALTSRVLAALTSRMLAARPQVVTSGDRVHRVRYSTGHSSTHR